MRKNDMKPDEFCPDCVNESSSAEIGTNEAEECCCCCCCSDAGSDCENNDETPGENQSKFNIEHQKKELLSHLSILRTNREPSSIQHILQFVEALTHSAEFLRNYNLQEDFCLECLLSEPTCTCCTNGISQININDTQSSFDECDGSDEGCSQRCSSQECADCIASAKAAVNRRQRNRQRRERRRRRRQINVRHNLPRVMAQPLIRNCSSTPNMTRDVTPSDAECSECQDSGCHSPETGGNQEACHDSNCEDCACEESDRAVARMRSSATYQGDTNDDSDFCQRCAEANLPSSSFCSDAGCKELGRNRRRTDVPRNTTRERRNNVQPSCTCCFAPESYQRQENANSKGTSKKMKTSDKPECDQQGTSIASCTDNDQSQSTECSCEDCQENSHCSEDSCKEFNNRRSNKYNKKGKKK